MSASPQLREPTTDSRPPRPRGRRLRVGTAPTIAVLVLASLSLMLLDLRGGPTDLLRSAGALLGGPVQTASDAVFGPLRTAEFRRDDVEALRQEVAALAEANQRLQTRNDLLDQELADEPEQWAAVARADRRLEAAVAGQVVAADPALGSAAVTLDVGADDGVVADSPVLVAGGLVGRVVEVSASTSSVQLVTDPDSSVAVRVGDLTALAQGTGDRRSVRLDHLDPLADVGVGQPVVTMGSDDGWPYPAGLPVATVNGVVGDIGELDRVVTAEPAAPLTALNHVIVLTEPAEDAS